MRVLWGVLVLLFDITGIRTSASFAQSGALWQNPPPQGADLSPVVPLDPGTATAVSDMLAGATDVHALFDLRTPTTGPLPTDWFTVCEASHNTPTCLDPTARFTSPMGMDGKATLGRGTSRALSRGAT